MSKKSEYRFDNYFSEGVNAATVEALHNIVNPSASSARITILEGKSGAGKTHLLRALQNESPYSNTKYISIGEVNRLVGIAARRGNEVFSGLTAELVNTDLLLIDDVMFVASREFTTWYLLEIIKRINSNSHIVLAGDIVLEEFIQQLEEINTSIQHLQLFFPETEALRKIVWYKATEVGIENKLNNNLVEWVLEQANWKPYRIEGTLSAFSVRGLLDS